MGCGILLLSYCIYVPLSNFVLLSGISTFREPDHLETNKENKQNRIKPQSILHVIYSIHK